MSGTSGGGPYDVSNWRSLEAYSEAYEVARTFEVVGNNGETYRIEVLRALSPEGSTPLFSARYWRASRVGAPWCREDAGRPDQAITEADAAWQALGFLGLKVQP